MSDFGVRNSFSENFKNILSLHFRIWKINFSAHMQQLTKMKATNVQTQVNTKEQQTGQKSVPTQNFFTYAQMYTCTHTGTKVSCPKTSSTVTNVCTHTHILTSLNNMKPILVLLNVRPAAQSSSGDQQQHLKAYVFDYLILSPRCFCGV